MILTSGPPGFSLQSHNDPHYLSPHDSHFNPIWSLPQSHHDPHRNPTMILITSDFMIQTLIQHDPYLSPTMILTSVPPWSSPLSHHDPHLSPTMILTSVPPWSSPWCSWLSRSQERAEAWWPRNSRWNFRWTSCTAGTLNSKHARKAARSDEKQDNVFENKKNNFENLHYLN